MGRRDVVAMRHKIVDLLGFPVLKHLEVVLRESSHQVAGGVMHHNIDVNDAAGNANGIVGCRRRSLRDRQGRAEQKCEQAVGLRSEHEALEFDRSNANLNAT